MESPEEFDDQNSGSPNHRSDNEEDSAPISPTNQSSSKNSSKLSLFAYFKRWRNLEKEEKAFSIVLSLLFSILCNYAFVAVQKEFEKYRILKEADFTIKSALVEKDRTLKENAALGLALLGKLALLTEEYENSRDDHLLKIINEFDNNYRLNLSELEKIRNLKTLNQSVDDRVLSSFDQNERLRLQIDQIQSNLRTQISWMKNGELTLEEKGIIDEQNLIHFSSQLIHSLDQIESAIQFSIHGQDEAFKFKAEQIRVRTRNLLAALSETNLDDLSQISTLLDGYQKEIEDINRSFKTFFDQNHLKIQKYESFIENLRRDSTFGVKNTFIELTKHESVAKSVRLKAIESLGVVGNWNDLKLLMNLYRSNDKDVREKALIAIIMIRTKDRKPERFSN